MRPGAWRTYHHAMPTKVKRGLGLLVVAVAAWLLALPIATNQGAPDWLMPVALLLGVVMLCSLFGGLVLLAWGLLRG